MSEARNDGAHGQVGAEAIQDEPTSQSIKALQNQCNSVPDLIKQCRRTLHDGEANIPFELKQHKAWVCWRIPRVKATGKFDKVPYYPVSGAIRRGEQGSAEDLAALGTWDEAWDAFKRNKSYAGVGLAMLPQLGLVAFDADRCVTAGDGIRRDVARIVENTYAELSPSGAGVRAFWQGTSKNGKNDETGLELYAQKQFVTVTGHQIENTFQLAPCGLPELPDCLRAELETLCSPAKTAPDMLAKNTVEHTVEGGDMASRALLAIPNHFDRKGWLKLLFAYHAAAGEDGYSTALAWSEQHESHDQAEFDKAWHHIKDDKPGGVPSDYLYYVAEQHGFDERTLQGFGVITLTPEEAVESDFWAQRNAAKAQRQADAAIQKAKSIAEDAKISFVDFASMLLPPPRQWVVQEWLPRGAVTSLFGRGGHGKSLLAQQLGTAVANGAPWLGLRTVAGPVLGLFCEDEDDELQRRQHAIFTNTFIDPVEGSKNLFLDARPGKFNTLVSFGMDRLAAPTLLMYELRAQCEKLRPALVILDNIAQLFAGQENARTEVTQFCNELTGIARSFSCAVLMLGHTAKAEGSEFSGSTAWDAAVRSRLFLARQDDGTSLLRKVKANYSALDEIRIEYMGGSFSPLPMGSQNSPEVLDAVKPLIFEAIERFTAREVSTSHQSTARTYLIKQMKAEQMLGSASEKIAHAAMVQMIDDGELKTNAVLPWKNSSRHPVHGLAVTK